MTKFGNDNSHYRFHRLPHFAKLILSSFVERAVGTATCFIIHKGHLQQSSNHLIRLILIAAAK
jgi:hypothetical protein